MPARVGLSGRQEYSSSLRIILWQNKALVVAKRLFYVEASSHPGNQVASAKGWAFVCLLLRCVLSMRKNVEFHIKSPFEGYTGGRGVISLRSTLRMVQWCFWWKALRRWISGRVPRRDRYTVMVRHHLAWIDVAEDAHVVRGLGDGHLVGAWDDFEAARATLSMEPGQARVLPLHARNCTHRWSYPLHPPPSGM